MARTTRYGLTALAPGETLGSSGGQFGYGDRFLIDRLLAAAEVHNHLGGERLADPTGPPGLQLFTEQGQLPAGTTFYYRVSYLDEWGLETAASPEATVTTPSAASAPGAPLLIADGRAGSLPEGTYQYGVTAVVNGQETSISPAAMVTLDEPEAIVVRPQGLPAEATGYYVWRLPQDGAEFMRVNKTAWPVGIAEYVDDGSIPWDPCACLDPSLSPPRTNRTNATNVVAVAVPLADQDLVRRRGLRWRIYRSVTSGAYGYDSLVAEVVLTEDELDPSSPRVTIYMDYGDDKATGVPLEVSQTLQPTRPITAEAVTVTLDGEKLTLADAIAAGRIGGGGGGDAEGIQADLAQLRNDTIPIRDILPTDQNGPQLGGPSVYSWYSRDNPTPVGGEEMWARSAGVTWVPAYTDLGADDRSSGWSIAPRTSTSRGEWLELVLPEGFLGGNLILRYQADVTDPNQRFWAELGFNAGAPGSWRMGDEGGWNDWSLFVGGAQPLPATTDLPDDRAGGWFEREFYAPVGTRSVVFFVWGDEAVTGDVKLQGLALFPTRIDYAAPILFFRPEAQLLIWDDARYPTRYLEYRNTAPPPTLTSPNGARFQLAVDDAGTLTAVPLTGGPA